MNQSIGKRLGSFGQRFKESIAEYGVIALAVHYVIFGVVIALFYLGIRAGWTPTSGAGTAGTWGAAYIAAKLTQPLRIVATVVLTPVVVRSWKRLSGKHEELRGD